MIHQQTKLEVMAADVLGKQKKRVSTEFLQLLCSAKKGYKVDYKNLLEEINFIELLDNSNIDNRLTYLYLQKYVKQDGSTPFLAPQSGIDAVTDDQLATLKQVKQHVNDTAWKTSGNTQSAVGSLPSNSELPEEMTFQQVCDAIFYGDRIYLNTPSTTIIDSSIKIGVRIDRTDITKIIIYEDNNILLETTNNELNNGELTINSNSLLKDTNIKLEAYSGNKIYTIQNAVKITMPIFIGTIKINKDLTQETFNTVIEEDSVNNKYVYYTESIKTITSKFNFVDPELRNLIIAVPSKYPNLVSISNKFQEFREESFEKTDIRFIINDKSYDYKVYRYIQNLSSLNSDVNFNFI